MTRLEQLEAEEATLANDAYNAHQAEMREGDGDNYEAVNRAANDTLVAWQDWHRQNGRELKKLEKAYHLELYGY